MQQAHDFPIKAAHKYINHFPLSIVGGSTVFLNIYMPRCRLLITLSDIFNLHVLHEHYGGMTCIHRLS